MKRPFADQRILGPFAQTDKNGIVFRVSYTVTDLNRVKIDTLEDNLEDRLHMIDDDAKDVDIIHGAGPGDVKVRVHYEGDEFTDDLEDSMTSTIIKEMQRIGIEEVEQTSYKYIF